MDDVNVFFQTKDKAQKIITPLILGLSFSIPISTALTTVFMLLILGVWFVSGSFKEKCQQYWQHPLTLPLFIIFGIALVGLGNRTVGAEYGFDTFKDYIRLMYIPILGFYLRNTRLQRGVMVAFVCAMILTLVLGYLKVYAHLPIGLKYTMGAVFKSHIKTSYFMAVAAFMLVIYALNVPRSRFWVAGLVLAMLYYLFFLSFGRIGHLTILLLALTIAWHYRRWAGLLSTLGGLILLLLLVYCVSGVFSERVNILKKDWVVYQQGEKLSDSSLGSRIAFYKTSAFLFMAHPLMGVGTGGFEKAYRDYYVNQNTLLTDNPHNQYFKVMVELGVFGFLALMFLFYRAWSLGGMFDKSTRLLVHGCLLSFYVGCLLNSWLSDFTESYFFILFCAAALSCEKFSPGFSLAQPFHDQGRLVR